MRTRESNGHIMAADLEAEPPSCILTIRRKTRGGSAEDVVRRRASALDGDDEISFNMESTTASRENGQEDDSDDGDEFEGSCGNGGPAAKSKGKRKSSAEKFLEDNVNYFQLEVLPCKTRSTKPLNGDATAGYHNSFLDFLKSKGVEGSGEDGDGDEGTNRARSRNRHKSGPVGGGLSGQESSTSRDSRPRASSFHHQSPPRSDSEDSFKRRRRSPPRSRSPFSTGANNIRSRSRARARQVDASPSGSEAESAVSKKHKTPRKRAVRASDSSDDESETEKKSTRSRRSRVDLSSPSPGKKSRRSELDKLLEAVDTSFHFETAAAAAKRMSGSPNLGPLEINVSDSNCESESSDKPPPPPLKMKRKTSESDLEPTKQPAKKQKGGGGGNDLLKTLSPNSSRKKTIKEEEESDSENGEEGGPTWDGWDRLNETLAATNCSPVPVDDLHFSFEATPKSEGWFQTYSRQDGGEDIVYYPESRGFPFPLPYEMPLSLFMPESKEAKVTKKLPAKNAPPAPPTNHIGKFKKRKVSDCDSTDSSESSSRRGKPKLGAKMDQLLDMQQHRVSPRGHPSTKDERELLFPGMMSLPFQLIDETSNDSTTSSIVRPWKRESVGDVLQLAASLDKFFRQPDELDPAAGRSDESQPSSTTSSGINTTASSSSSRASKDKSADNNNKQQPTTVPPTRSRVSSDELLLLNKTRKDKQQQQQQKRKKDRSSLTSDLVMDQVVQNQVDAVLLDCLEDELPTVPFDGSSELHTLLDTYQSCQSMNVCNSRWLRPSRPAVLGAAGQPGDESSSSTGSLITSSGAGGANRTKKATPWPLKPKRFVIYKEDLPGFRFDNDIEPEKLPVSRRCLAKSGAIKEDQPVAAAVTATTPLPAAAADAEPKKSTVEGKPGPQVSPASPKRSPAVKKKGIKREVFISRKDKKLVATAAGGDSSPATKADIANLDDDTASVTSNASSSSRKKGRRKANKTGFPSSPKKKKRGTEEESSSPTPEKKSAAVVEPSPGSGGKKPKQSGKVVGTPPLKKSSSSTRQLKMDKFVTKMNKVKSSTATPTKSSTTQNSKNNLGKRSTTLQAKNYSELESDTESLLESKVPYRSPHIKAVMPVAAKKKGSRSR